MDADDGVDLEAHCSPATSTEDNTDVDIDSVDLSHLQVHQQHQIREILTSYKDVFRDVPDIADFPAYHLETADSPPVNQPPYRPGLAWRDKVKQAVQKLLDAGYVRPSTSPWSSPVIPVPGSIRLVVDYRKVNSLTQPDKYPIPCSSTKLEGRSTSPHLTLAKVTTRWH